MSDHASTAAAATAGFTLIQTDRGASRSPRYFARIEKNLVGEPGQSGTLWGHEGGSDVSQVAADAQALAALNGARRFRYGAGAAAGSGGSGGALTFDVS